MADLKKPPVPFSSRTDAAGQNLLYLRDEELRQGIELLYFAYRAFTSDPDAILAEHGYGRAHHRVIHFVKARPGLSVAELLQILKITKQSLSRVLKQLVEDGMIESRQGRDDRRKRILRLTPAGETLAARVAAIQRERVARAYRQAGPEAVAGWRKVLAGLLDEEERETILDFVNRR
ncbi:MarR family winged helix-turn-helix transcriptional regulator [Futiania mangrovi]|uniref:MarR family winged helix-turn-helix transcriptional regulator n=1 Tax=Futiania mangrovi TaxID=2959716 RepID=UPI0022AE6BAA|nr:MarR family transcriptional regulator [Futiania mangrovii]